MDQQICLICLKDYDLVSIFDLNNGISILTKLESISHEKQIELLNEEDVNIPYFVCNDCCTKINSFYDFQKKIEDSLNYFKNLIKEINYEDNGSDDIIVDEFDHTEIEQKYEIDKNIETNIKIEILSENSFTKIIKKPENNSGVPCDICNKIISSKIRLKYHMRTHTGEKSYKCELCNKSFSIAYNLKVHQRTHTGEKPLACEICGKKFAHSGGLTSHKRLHTGENPYKCHLCSRGFKTTSHLKYHIRLHNGEKNFKCKTCDKAFIAKCDLNQHEKVHTGIRPYICTICGLSLTRSYHLARHMLTHTNIKEFKCVLCGSEYRYRYDLKRHLKNHPTVLNNYDDFISKKLL